MVRTPLQVVREHLRLAAVENHPADDAELLRRHQAGIADAFAGLVERHGPMVYGVCRRVLGRSADADDVFQATFLTLARNPAAVRQPNALAGWLHRVALRTARKALARRRPTRPVDASAASPAAGPAEQAAWADVRHALDEELNRLPGHLRAPLVLCYLDGATRDEAARRLNLSVGTLDRRLAAGRARLRDRLSRRGLAAVGLGTAVVADGLRAAVPVELARATSGLARPGAVTPLSVQALVGGGLPKLLPLAASVVLLGGLAAALIGSVGGSAGDETPAERAPAPRVAKPDADLFGEPLPEGAIARLGSPRFRHAALADFAWLPGGKSIATVGSDRVVRTWDVETGRQTKEVALKKESRRAFALSADGKLAATADLDAATVFDAATGDVLATLGNESRPAVFGVWGRNPVGFSPDGKLLHVIGDDGRMAVTVWDWRAGKAQAVPVELPKSGGVTSSSLAHFSPDGKLFVAGVGPEVPLTLFDTATWKKVRQFDCAAAASMFTPDGNRLIAYSLRNDKGTGEVDLRVFDVRTGRQLQQFPMGHYDRYFSLAITPDGKTLGSGGSEQGCLIDLTTGKVLHRLTGLPWGIGFSPDGKTFAANTTRTHLRLWDVATGKERYPQTGDFSPHRVIAASPDGRLLAAASSLDRAVHLWDAATGRHVNEFPLRGKGGGYARGLTFSADGRKLAAGLLDGTVQEWEVATGKEARAWQLAKDRPADGPSPHFEAIQVAPDGRRLITVEYVFGKVDPDTRLSVWDAATGKPIRQRSLPGLWRRFSWSADAMTIALDTGVTLIDLDTVEERARLDGSAPETLVVAMGPEAMSADGRLVAAMRGDPTTGAKPVGIYEVLTGGRVTTLPAHWVFAIGRDNRTLFTVDGTHVRAWDLATGKELAGKAIPEASRKRWRVPTVTGLVPLAGRRVFTALADGTGLVWDFAPAPPAGGKADEKQLAAWWDDLRADDAARAYAAVWRLADTRPEAVVPFLGRHLRPDAAPDPKGVQKLIADLDSDTFRIREQATKELQHLGHAAAPALQGALAAKPAPETARRIEQLLARSRLDLFRRLRAMQVLERAGTAEARAVLAKLADGLPLSPETREARAAAARTSP